MPVQWTWMRGLSHKPTIPFSATHVNPPPPFRLLWHAVFSTIHIFFMYPYPITFLLCISHPTFDYHSSPTWQICTHPCSQLLSRPRSPAIPLFNVVYISHRDLYFRSPTTDEYPGLGRNDWYLHWQVTAVFLTNWLVEFSVIRYGAFAARSLL